MERVAATRAPQIDAEVRLTNEQQWDAAVSIGAAKFRDTFPGATITDARLHNPNGAYGVTRTIWTPNFRIEGEYPDGRTAMIEGLLDPVHLGQPLDDVGVASFVQHESPASQSGAGVAAL